MFSTFSATKYPKYLDKIDTDKRYRAYSVNDIMTDLEKIINRYNIKVMVAHNGQFDKKAIGRLCEEFGKENPIEKLDLLDTMEISKIITFSKEYSEYCLLHKDRLNNVKESCFITASGRVRTTAQAIYCYLTDNAEFEEKHDGLNDIDIEIAIFEQSIARLGNTMVNLNVAPSWKDYAKVIEED